MDRLPKCDANYVPLTPLTFLKRAAMVYSSRTSIIYYDVTFTWLQTYKRCCRLASALRSFNIVKNDVVSVLAPNIPAMYEMHFAVPMAGAVLNTINTRLDAKNIATILRHSEAKILFVDYQYVPLARDALRLLMANVPSNKMPFVVVIDDLAATTGIRLGELEYEQLVCQGNPGYIPGEIIQEWDPIALNYTSGTTSEPKGVVYSHRGAYLSTLSLILGWEMKTEPVYLWSLPMFHCNGWTFTWGVAARGGTNVCIRNTTAREMYESIHRYNVTHMCCAPIVFNILLEAEPHEQRPAVTKKVEILTGGAPPPAALLERIEGLGFHVTHAYGLTEATGPALVCEWKKEWNEFPGEEQAKLKARQGICTLTLADVDVKDCDSMASVPRDGKTMGEIVLRGSSIMKGYLKDEMGTRKTFRNGWFWTGDVGVVHPDGYVEIKDRSKDVIISGGENISSVEVEAALYKHADVVEAAVVAMPHPKWGESPCAFVVMRNRGGSVVTEMDIIDHCRKNMPGYMVPKKVHFMADLPKTSTGKVQKFELRAMTKNFVVSDHTGSRKAPTADSAKNKIRETPSIYYDHHDQTQHQQHHNILAVSRL
ncbi:trans-cinnamate:CoA ligase, peroxisomal-like [Henckelia pumila]|uniref:trans-cinnamate:CoA ligase, peroxisomal-like n=1 Tax=Henckelia pumila TaxID=405737 RepID=UPI003C6E3A38